MKAYLIIILSVFSLVRNANEDTTQVIGTTKPKIELLDTSSSVTKDTLRADSTTLETTIVNFLDQATDYIKGKNKPKSFWSKLYDFLKNFIALLISIVTLIAGYLGLRKTNLFEKYKPQIYFIFIILLAVIISSLFVNIISSILLLIITIVFSIVILAYILLQYFKFFDNDTVNLKQRILDYFEIEPYETDDSKIKLEKLEDYHIQFIYSFKSSLEAITQHMLLNKEYTLVIPHSFVEGYEFTRIELVPNELAYPHWRNLNDRLLLPENLIMQFVKEIDDGQEKEKKFSFITLKNFQTGIAITSSIDNELEFHKLDDDAIIKISHFIYYKSQEELNKSLKKFDEIFSNFKLYNL